MEKATKKFPEEAAISCFGKPEEAADLMAYMVSTAAKLMLELLPGWMAAQSKDIGSGEFITDVTR